MKLSFTKIAIVLSSLFFLAGCSSGDTADGEQGSSASSNLLLDQFNNILDSAPEEDDLSSIVSASFLSEDPPAPRLSEDPPTPPAEEEQPPVVSEDPAPEEEEQSTVISEDPAPEEEEQPPVVSEDPAPEEEEEEIVDNEGDNEISEDPSQHQCIKQKYYTVKMLDGTNSPASRVRAYNSSLPARVNYNYYSWSAHTIVGAQPKEFEGNFYIYEGSDGVSFNFMYNVDAGGSPDNQVRMDVIITGNDGVDRVLISDDSAEVKRTVSEDGQALYEAKLHYWSNTDGGSIGPLSNNNFKARVKIYYVGDNKEVVFHSSDGGIVPLELAQSTPTLFSEFEVTFDEEVETCSAEADQLIARNQCIDEQYQAQKDNIEGADWQQFYRDLIAERRAQVTKLKAEHDVILAEKKAASSTEVSTSRLSIKDLQKERQADLAERRSKYKALLNKLKSDFKENRKSLKGSALRDLLNKYRSDVKQARNEFRSSYQAANKEHLARIQSSKARFSSASKSSRSDLRSLSRNLAKERKALADKLLKDARLLRRDAMANQDRVHKAFEDSLEQCFN